jgi:hypothetical protein
VSGSEHQRKGVSLETQTNATNAYAKRQLGWVIEGEFLDVRSGKRADRPDYQRMLARAAGGASGAASWLHRRSRQGPGPAWRVTLGMLPSVGATVGNRVHGVVSTPDRTRSAHAMPAEAPLLAHLLADTQDRLVDATGAAAMW